MPLHDATYKHWTGTHLGIWYRRAVIARQGLHACLESRWTRHLLVICWSGALVLVVALFAIGQLLVADSLIVQWTGNLDPALQMFARALTRWLEQHPEISVRTTQNIVFYFGSQWLLPLSLLVVAQAMPHLITRDLASRALTIYASKAIGPLDYLVGKFSTVFGLLTLTWLGPLVAAWLLGNLLAPDWHFFWHARFALFNTLIHGLTTMGILSLLALGVSAISSKEKTTVAIWLTWWIVGYVLVGIASDTKAWLKHLSFKHNLDTLALGTFRLYDDVKLAQDTIPVLGDLLRNVKPETFEALRQPATGSALLALLVMGTLAVIILRRRLRPE